MRRKTTSKRGRIVWLVAAAALGYLIGTWNATAVRSPQDGSAARTVALRFPQNLSDAPVVQVADQPNAAAGAPMVLGDTHLALFEPQPLIPQMAPQQTTAAPEPPPVVTTERPQVADLSPTLPMAAVAPPPRPRSVPVASPAKPPESRAASRPGYMLDDAQIGSIKRRLHLTPDQERMWPAVEVALRNIAFAKSRDARHRGTPGGIDPNSTEVQDLKSAAIPLLMSFSDEQKDEVRSLVHVMGLDQLASQF